MSTTSVHPNTAAIDAVWYIIQSQSATVRKAITKRLLEAEREAKKRRQQKMVKESLTRALNEVAEAKRTGKKLMPFDDFLIEMDETKYISSNAKIMDGI